MFKLLFGILFGAGLMYFLDPRQGQERRQALTDKFRENQDVSGRANEVFEAGKETVYEAKDHTQAVVNGARDRLSQTIEQAKEGTRDTVNDAKQHARDFAQSTQERAASTLNHESSSS